MLFRSDQMTLAGRRDDGRLRRLDALFPFDLDGEFEAAMDHFGRKREFPASFLRNDGFAVPGFVIHARSPPLLLPQAFEKLFGAGDLFLQILGHISQQIAFFLVRPFDFYHQLI